MRTTRFLHRQRFACFTLLLRQLGELILPLRVTQHL
jgi:hypothetical protein